MNLSAESWIFIYMLGMIVMMYFFVIRPGKKKNKKTKELHDSVAVGDVISTLGGIIGTVVERDKDYCTIRIDDNKDVTMRIVIQAVHSIMLKHDAN